MRLRGYSIINLVKCVYLLILKSEEIIDQYGGNYLSHLIYSGDKQFFTNENKNAFLMYRYKASSLVVLGDPIGDENAFDELLEAFYNYAEYLGYDVIFYQVTDQHMPLYHNFGNQFFKLGEEAIIDLTQFSTSGKNAVDLERL